MPSAQEIVAESRRLKDLLEKNWILPWHEGKASGSIWRHRLIHFLAQLPLDLFDETMKLLLLESSFALRGVALHLVRMRAREGFEPVCIELLQDPSIHVRALAAAALGQFGSEEGLEALLETKDSDNSEVKKSVAEALRRVRDPRSIPLLTRWVGRVGEEDALRRKICEALAEIGDEAAMPVLMRLLQDDATADEVRGEAARAIGIIGGPDARGLLLGGLCFERPWIRARCIEGLGLLGSGELLSKVVPFLNPEQPWMVRTHAVLAAARLGRSRALKQLLPLCRDQEVRIRNEVCVALGMIDSRRARARLQEMLDDPELSVRVQALDAFSRACGQDFGFRLEDHLGALDPAALQESLKRARAYELT